MYYNFKKLHSITLQTVVDGNNKFTFIEVGGCGKRHDSYTLRHSNFYKLLCTKSLDLPTLPTSTMKLHYVFIADGAYPLSTKIMKPFRGNN